MNLAIEMHDSECLAVETEIDRVGSVVLDAYVHRSMGEPGCAEGEGGIQRIRIAVKDMVVEGDLGELPAYVYEGSLEVGGTVFDNMIPFPRTYAATARLKMMLSDDARVVVISGTTLTILAESDFRYVERFSPIS